MFQVSMLALVVSLGGGLSSGCFDVAFGDGLIQCGQQSQCPDGLLCGADNMCYRDPVVADAGGGQSDANEIDTGGDSAQGTSFELVDTFADTNTFHDLSRSVLWGIFPPDTSAFQLLEHDGAAAIALRRGSPVDATIYNDLDNDAHLRGFSSIDYEFEQVVERTSTTLTIEFDAAWDALESGGLGETGKLHFILLHDYPEGGPAAYQDENLQGHPYGRPAYTLVVRNSQQDNSQPFVFYGGGTELDGILEQRSDPAFPNEGAWWTPGMVAPPGGGPTGATDPATDGFPIGSWTMSPLTLSGTQWQRFRLVVDPVRIQLFQDDALTIDMPLDRTSPAPQYRTFDQLSALRIFWRAANQAYLSNLRITATTAAE